MRVQEVMQRDVVTIDESVDLSSALQTMVYNDFRHLPVTREGRLVGVLSERDILAARPAGGGLFNLGGRAADAMGTPPEIIHPHAEVEEAAARMAVRKVGSLPVVDAGRLVGMLTTSDVLAVLAKIPVDLSEEAGADEPDVASVMTRKLAAVHGDDLVVEAASMMVRWGTRHLPVIDGLRRVRGIVSDRDVRSAIGDPVQAMTIEPATRRLDALRVEDIMTADPRTVREDDSLGDVVGVLLDERVGALPVVDDQARLRGMVSYLDVLKRLHARLRRAP